jgi:hypothetical protein
LNEMINHFLGQFSLPSLHRNDGYRRDRVIVENARSAQLVLIDQIQNDSFIFMYPFELLGEKGEKMALCHEYALGYNI